MQIIIGLAPGPCRPNGTKSCQYSADVIEDMLENDWNDTCFCFFQYSVVVVLYFLKLHDKHTVGKKRIYLTRCETG